MKKVIMIMISFSILIMVTLLFTELYLRVYNNNYSSAEELFNKKAKGLFGDKTSYRCNWGSTLYPHPYLGIIHKRDNRENCLTSRVNSEGMYGPEYPSIDDNKTFNILISGGSVAYNLIKWRYDVGRYGEIKHRLETNYLGPNGKKIRVFGGAIGSWKQPQQLINYITHQDKFDAILSIEGGNELNTSEDLKFDSPFSIVYQVGDYRDLNLRTSVAIYEALSSLREKLINSYLLSWALLRYSSYLNELFGDNMTKSYIVKVFQRKIDEKTDYKDELYSEYEKYIDTFRTLTKLNKQKFALFFQPTILRFKVRHTEEKKINFRNDVLKDVYPEIVDKMISINSKNIYSLLKIFENNLSHIYNDYIHFKNIDGKILGHKIIVDEILKKIRQDWKIKRLEKL